MSFRQVMQIFNVENKTIENLIASYVITNMTLKIRIEIYYQTDITMHRNKVFFTYFWK